MQKDFHYYTIRILSEYAGFSSSESQIIAYASQYVDDATEHKPIKLPEKYKIELKRLKDLIFDPVCTAHKGLQFLNDFKKDVQMKIYMCFHFLPAEVYKKNQKDYDYVTKPNSNFAKILTEKLKKDYIENTKDNIYNLIAIGIGMHTYADTWAHQNFSGRNSITDNDVENINTWDGKKWNKLSAVQSIKNNILPEIGHAEVNCYPDFPFLTWNYKQAKSKQIITRHNLDIYIDAAYNIYKYLLSLTKKKSKWISFSDRLIHCFSYINESEEKRCNHYIKNFPEIGFYYDDSDWKNEILKTDMNYVSEKTQRNQQDFKWLKFHQAALSQREFVLENIKSL